MTNTLSTGTATPGKRPTVDRHSGARVPGGQKRAFEEFGRLPRDAVAEKYDSEVVGHPSSLPVPDRRGEMEWRYGCQDRRA